MIKKCFPKAEPRRDRAELLLAMVGALLAVAAEKVAPVGTTRAISPHHRPRIRAKRHRPYEISPA